MSPSAIFDARRPDLNPIELELHNESSDVERDVETGVVVTNMSTKKPIKRRATFSIAPEQMAAAQGLFRQKFTIFTEKKNIANHLRAESQTRRDSSIDLDYDDEVLSPSLLPDNDYTPHPIDGKDYMDKVFSGKIIFPPVKKARLTHVEDDKKRLAAAASAMPKDGVMMVKSSMEEMGSVFLPQELKT